MRTLDGQPLAPGSFGGTMPAPGQSRGLLAWLRDAVGGWFGPRLSVDTPAGAEVEQEQAHSGPVGVTLPWFLPYLDDATHETAKIRAAYRLMFADPNVKAALLGKILAVGALDLQIRPPARHKKDKYHQEVADFNRWVLTERLAGGIPGLAWSVLSGGCIDGYSISEKVFSYQEQGQFAGKWPLTNLKPKDTGNDVVPLTDSFRNIVGVQGLRYNAGQVFSPSRFLIWRHLPLFDVPTGTSDLRAAYSRWWMLDTCWKLRAMGMEKRALPFFLGTFQRADQQSPLAQVLAQVKSQNWVTVPEGVKVEAINIAGSAEGIWSEFVSDCKHDIFLGIQGAILQALEGTVADGRGSSQVHRGTADLLVWYIAHSLSSLLNDHDRGLIKDITDLNYVVDEYSRATLSAVDVNEMLAEAELDSKLISLGLELSKEDAYERYGRTPPETHEDALSKPEAQPLEHNLNLVRPGGSGPPEPPEPPDPFEDLDEGVRIFAESDWTRTQGKHGGTYWLRQGRPDIPANRHYGRDNPGLEQKSGAQQKKKAKRGAAAEEWLTRPPADPEQRQALNVAMKAMGKQVGGAVWGAIQKARHGVGHLEHVVSEWVREKIPEKIAALPGAVRQPVAATWWLARAGTAAAFASHTWGQQVAEQVARERGATALEAATLKGTLSGIDLVGAKAVPLALEFAGLGALALPAAFVPAASAAYILHSARKHPIKVLKAAAKVTARWLHVYKDPLAAGAAGPAHASHAERGASPREPSPASYRLVGELLDAIGGAGEREDWFRALFLMAFDATADFDQSLEFAREACREERPPGDDEEFAEGWEEGSHPRDQGGQFTSGGGNRGGSGQVKSQERQEYEQDMKAWEGRKAARQKRRENLAATEHADDAYTRRRQVEYDRSQTLAEEAQNPGHGYAREVEGYLGQVRDSFLSRSHDYRACLANGLDAAGLAEYDQAATKGLQGIERADKKVQTALARHQAAAAARDALGPREAEPVFEEPPPPPELAELNTRAELMDPEQEDFDRREFDRLETEIRRVDKEHDRAIEKAQAAHDKAHDAWEKREQKRDRADEKLEATAEDLDDALNRHDAEVDQQLAVIERAEMPLRTLAEENLDDEDADDEEPEEPDDDD